MTNPCKARTQPLGQKRKISGPIHYIRGTVKPICWVVFLSNILEGLSFLPELSIRLLIGGYSNGSSCKFEFFYFSFSQLDFSFYRVRFLRIFECYFLLLPDFDISSSLFRFDLFRTQSFFLVFLNLASSLDFVLIFQTWFCFVFQTWFFILFFQTQSFFPFLYFD